VAHCDDVACTGATVSVLDSASGVGSHTSVAIGADGLGLISYWEGTHGTLKVAHCNNLACTRATLSTVDTGPGVGLDTSVAIGTDGRALVSYYDASNRDLKVAHLPYGY
jgi:hypothetical protein